MGQNPLRNKGTKDFIKFAEMHEFSRGRVSGDDVIYWHPDKIHYIKITLNKKDGTPIRTVDNMVRTSGIDKHTWRKWFS